MNGSVYDFEELAEDAHTECEHCGKHGTHYGPNGEHICLECLRERLED